MPTNYSLQMPPVHCPVGAAAIVVFALFVNCVMLAVLVDLAVLLVLALFSAVKQYQRAVVVAKAIQRQLPAVIQLVNLPENAYQHVAAEAPRIF